MSNFTMWIRSCMMKKLMKYDFLNIEKKWPSFAKASDGQAGKMA